MEASCANCCGHSWLVARLSMRGAGDAIRTHRRCNSTIDRDVAAIQGNELWWGAAVSAVPLALSEQALVLRVREGGATQRASAWGCRSATSRQHAAE